MLGKDSVNCYSVEHFQDALNRRNVVAVEGLPDEDLIQFMRELIEGCKKRGRKEAAKGSGPRKDWMEICSMFGNSRKNWASIIREMIYRNLDLSWVEKDVDSLRKKGFFQAHTKEDKEWVRSRRSAEKLRGLGFRSPKISLKGGVIISPEEVDQLVSRLREMRSRG